MQQGITRLSKISTRVKQYNQQNKDLPHRSRKYDYQTKTVTSETPSEEGVSCITSI